MQAPDVLAGRDVRLVLATSTGGVGRHIRSLAAGLVAAGADVSVCGPAATEALFGFTDLGARFRPVEIASGFAVRRDLAAVRALAPELAGADLVHAHGLRAGLVTAIARRRGVRSPYVVTWHNAVLGGSRVPFLHARLERMVARAPDLTLTVSVDLADRVRRLGGHAVRVQPVGGPALAPPTRDGSDIRTELAIGSAPIVLTVGRLHKQKGIDVLIRAATGWSDREPRPVLVIAGDGPDRNSLRELADRLDVDIRLLGRRDDVADLLATAAVVVLPSRWEGSPLSAREALAAGRPLVATAVGGVPDLLDDTHARLVPPEDPVALGRAVMGLLDDPAAAASLAKSGQLALSTWPDEATTVAAVLSTYAELLT